jgi:ferric-dicitrate binding protein FerR (iron transport regulator)
MTPPEPKPSDRELSELIADVLDGTATADARARLERLLASDAEARRLWRRHVNLHAALRTRFALPRREESASEMPTDSEAVAAPAADAVGPDDPPAPPRRVRWVVWAAAAAVMAASAALVVAVARWSADPAGHRGGGSLIGHVSRSAEAKWAHGETLGVGSPLASRTLDLTAGLAELTLTNGVRITLDAPVRLRLVSPETAALETGRLVALVPPAARGFTVETPQTRVIDLGTEFGVGVGSGDGSGNGGETEVHVFQGEVVAEWKAPDGRTSDDRLAAGKAISVAAGAAPKGIPCEPQRFVRMFPTDVDAGQMAGPLYNRSRFDTVHAVPARAAPAIDGDLSDWDRSGAFFSACMPPFHESHTLEGMMMYDDRRLYLAAHVGDPAPMRSRSDPAAGIGPDRYAWSGGSVIVRLSTDPALGWPLKGLGKAEGSRERPEIGRRPEDVTDRIVHVIMWYHQPTGRPRLQLSFGMDFHGEVNEPEGFEGAFRADPNGLGYTLEYAIPWAALKAAARPPKGGDVVGANWTVHWSDREGRVSRGFLTEITNLDVRPYRFLRAGTWGKAEFHAEGRLPADTVRPRAIPADGR